jgi:lysophospholipase L1-like esterase
MLECLILGDSIAVGIAQQRPECVAYVKSGINSWSWNNQHITKNLSGKTVVISLGANDHKGVKTKQELYALRQVINAEHVFWISPGMDRKPTQQIAIEEIAKQYGDTVLARPSNHMSADGIHPTGRGYKELATSTKGR